MSFLIRQNKKYEGDSNEKRRKKKQEQWFYQLTFPLLLSESTILNKSKNFFALLIYIFLQVNKSWLKEV